MVSADLMGLMASFCTKGILWFCAIYDSITTAVHYFIESYCAKGDHLAHRVYTDHNPTQALSPQPHAFTLARPPDSKRNLTWPIHLTRTSLDCGRKPEHLEKTHADMGRLCTLHTDSDPNRDSNPGPWCCEAAVLTIVPPCRPLLILA